MRIAVTMKELAKKVAQGGVFMYVDCASGYWICTFVVVRSAWKCKLGSAGLSREGCAIDECKNVPLVRSGHEARATQEVIATREAHGCLNSSSVRRRAGCSQSPTKRRGVE